MRLLSMRRTPRRRGFVTILVMVAMVAATLIALASLERVAQRTQGSNRPTLSGQIDLIGEGAISLTNARLQGDANYQGETWRIPTEETSLKLPTTVTIQVSSGKDERRRNIEIQIELGDEDATLTRETLNVILPLPKLEQE